MKYLSMLADDEIKYICSVIPLQDSVNYFRQYPKYFSKVISGFRAKSFRDQEQVSRLLFRCRNQPYISSFLESHISEWLDQIQERIEEIIGKGETKESAWLQILPFCYFVGDIGIFFRLIEEQMPEEVVSLLSQSICKVRDMDIDIKRLNESLSEEEKKQVKLKSEINNMQSKLDNCYRNLREGLDEIETLKNNNSRLERMEKVVRAKEQKIEELERMLQQRNAAITDLNKQMSVAANEQRQIEIRIREEIEQEKMAEQIETVCSLKPRCPNDIGEFKDYLGYNLENIGIEANADYYVLLKDYICEILFTGKPVLVNRNSGMTLIKCISNALVSSPEVSTLTFSTDVTSDNIERFLLTPNRIMCLDNFIGNFDETILSTICERHKNKIIFLTVTYDKTLRYLPSEFLSYCHYINLNRMKAFICGRDLSEDPSSVEESDVSFAMVAPDTVWAPLLKEILEEVCLEKSLIIYKSSLVTSEEILVQLLTFDILPYCVDVLNIAPFMVSERLNKYAGESGRCAYKALLGRWFS